MSIFAPWPLYAAISALPYRHSIVIEVCLVVGQVGRHDNRRLPVLAGLPNSLAFPIRALFIAFLACGDCQSIGRQVYHECYMLFGLGSSRFR